MSAQAELLETQPSERHGHCQVCGRALKNPKYVAIGIGPICSGKLWKPVDTIDTKPLPARMVQRIGDVSVWRDDDGNVHANVPRSVVWHSPDGFECGYEGSGPADLALNILNDYVRPSDGATDEAHEPVPCYRGVASRFAARWHQDFKREFIGRMSREGGNIPNKVIAEWIEERRARP
jgi:hypothetical protein